MDDVSGAPGGARAADASNSSPVAGGPGVGAKTGSSARAS